MKNLIILYVFISISVSTLFSQSNEIIDVEEIKEGMKGYGYTIVQGTNVTKFDVTVVSVLKKYRSGADAILIRLEGDYFDHTGVASGMSGSPIYIEDKLAGALAFGWSFSKDPIVGVTPIKYMLDLYDVEPTDPSNSTKVTNIISFNNANPKNEPQNNNSTKKNVVSSANGSALPIPMLFSGFSDTAFGYYSKFYENMGFLTAGGGSGNNLKYSGEKFVNGDGVAIVLIDGDLSIAGVGTVTTTDDDKYLVFGHSMYGKGLLKAPVAKAYINSIIPSLAISFKLGSPTSYVGYTTYDNTHGVAGVYGEMPDNLMVPVNLKIENNIASNVGGEMNFRVLNNNEYFSDLLAMAIMSAVTSKGGNESGTFSISYEIYTDYFDKPYAVQSKILSFESLDAYVSLIKNLLAPVEFMLFNPFKPIEIKKINIKLNHDPIDFAIIEDVSLVEEVARAGQRINLRVGVRKYQSDKKDYYLMPLDLPKNLDSGLYTVYIANEYMYAGVEMAYMPSKYQIRELDDLMTIYSKTHDESILKTWIYSSADALLIDGTSFTHLPPSYYGMLRSEATTDKAILLTGIENTLKFNSPILGIKALTIYVKGANK